MTKNPLILLGVVALVALAALLFAVFRPPEQASAPLEAAPVIIETAPAAAAPTPMPPAPAAQSAETPTQPAAEASSAAGPVVFEIVSAQSQARFLIDEVLRGRPVRVVGATDQVAGQIAVDRNNPAASQVGLIRVNARTLTTDNEFRNRAIKNQILNTNAYEFVTFQPTALGGLPASVAVGQSFTFQIAGDLTIRDVTRSVTFDVTVTPVSETRIQGLAATTFPYRDFGLRIPDSPSVDTVADVVTLELEFVAEAK